MPPISADARTEAVAEPLLPRRLFLHGGRIHLGDGSSSLVEALLVENGRVVAAGTEEALGSQLEGANLVEIDLKGAVAVPGFQDAHSHVLRLGQELTGLDLGGAENLPTLLDAVAARAQTLTAGDWVLGFGGRWDEFTEEEVVNAAVLSEITPKHPVFLRSADGSTAIVNTLALGLVGLDKEQLLPLKIPGGHVEVDDQGLATGVFRDEAVRIWEPQFTTTSETGLEELVLAAQEELLNKGWTCVHDMGTSLDTVRAYERLRAKGLLRLRIVSYLDGNAGLSEEVLEAYPGVPDEGDLLSVHGVYFRLDGGLATRAAALIDEYSDAPEERGELILSETELTDLVHETWQQGGLQPAISAFGDLANRVAIDVYGRMSLVDEKFMLLRPRVEHAQVLTTKEMPRFPELRVLPSMQPGHSLADRSILEERLGELRASSANTWREMAPGLRQFAFGTDVPFGVADPLEAMLAARSGSGTQRLSKNDGLSSSGLDGRAALEAFTSGPAYAAHQEDRRGRLSPGYWADLTILSGDPTSCKPQELKHIKVLMTMINGELVYRP